MDKLERKTFETSRGYTYTYYFRPSQNASTPTILLCHGFPDIAHLWAGVVPSLLELPYGILIPNLLGYEGSSKPTDLKCYSFKGITDDLVEILDAEKIPAVTSGGHDWGSAISQTLYFFHPNRVVGAIIVSVSWLPRNPEQRFDLAALNAFTEQAFGYPTLEYWNFFTSPEAPALIEANIERFYEVIHGDTDDWMKKIFCVKDAMKKYLQGEGESVPLRPYAQDPAFKKSYIERLKRDGLAGPLSYYKAYVNGIDEEHQKQLRPENLKVTVPVLYIGCTGDAVCRTDMNAQPKATGLLPDLREEIVDGTHWALYDCPDKFAEYIVSFLKERF